MDILNLIGREKNLFEADIDSYGEQLSAKVENARFLVIGGAGSIGQAVTKEIFKRSPQKLHVVDISENNLVELVRDIRSSLGYIDGEFKTFALDIGSPIYDAFFESDGNYDYVLNLSALKHVRSEKDPFTLMRMVEVNILNTIKTIRQAKRIDARKYFCVSTDKAANPVNMMGASKRIMELFLMRESQSLSISTARFANVAFSDGSLLHGFNQRILKRQPLVAPKDIKRYFVTPQESGELCLMSCLLGDNKDIFFPKLSEHLHLITFAEIAKRYLTMLGYEVYECNSEEEARSLAGSLPAKGKWPCYFSISDTTGEKDFEEFFMNDEILDMQRFENLGVIKSQLSYDDRLLDDFLQSIKKFTETGKWEKGDLVRLFQELLPGFAHKETGKYLDSKM
ncbi:Polysaccharide biosynthesis protein [Cyclobacterium lianum]|uniref:Polysaccharide biosynthesis protein n=1 Tax=Cyclobacterium lianum TaxID=388280 RepID=A0A1M7NDV9_9BACT|nr:UDP-N-acetylglucosamine 4,6-dehydratase [Cyclobacterium lianum]SHN01846.1 Polysaccharide biosynthesis protein [Cyclobacterium lianum]